MINREKVGLRGTWTIEIRVDGKVIKMFEIDNQLTNLYRNSIKNQLYGNIYDSLEIKYLAVGTGTDPATAEDTELQDEMFRIIPTYQSIADDYVQTIWVVPPQIGNFTYREIGVYCGNATAEADSGMLLSRINVNIEKTSSMEITFIRRDYVMI